MLRRPAAAVHGVSARPIALPLVSARMGPPPQSRALRRGRSPNAHCSAERHRLSTATSPTSPSLSARGVCPGQSDENRTRPGRSARWETRETGFGCRIDFPAQLCLLNSGVGFCRLSMSVSDLPETVHFFVAQNALVTQSRGKARTDSAGEASRRLCQGSWKSCELGGTNLDRRHFPD